MWDYLLKCFGFCDCRGWMKVTGRGTARISLWVAHLQTELITQQSLPSYHVRWSPMMSTNLCGVHLRSLASCMYEFPFSQLCLRTCWMHMPFGCVNSLFFPVYQCNALDSFTSNIECSLNTNMLFEFHLNFLRMYALFYVTFCILDQEIHTHCHLSLLLCC